MPLTQAMRLSLLLALTALAPLTGAAERKTAVFAGGCFWCVEHAFDAVEGVVDHTAGFAGGHVEDPTYAEVTGGGTGHHEAVRVEYDPARVSYEELLHVYWRNIDPLDDGGQFCDRGPSYESAIFVDGEAQRRAAKASKAQLTASERFEEPIVTPIKKLEAFYPADEAYHQDYFEKSSLRYKFYVTACGRYGRLEEVWGDAARPQVE